MFGKQGVNSLADMRAHFADSRPEKSILVGDLNIAPREDDVWSHKQLLKVVSHTPIEVDHLLAAQDAQMEADDGPRMASTFMARAEGSFSVPGAGLGAAE